MRPLIIFFLFSTALLAQENSLPALKRGFASINLGDNSGETKKKLTLDAFFRYGGEPELDFSRQPEPILTVAGSGFIEQASLLFYQEKLYLIELGFDTSLVSYEYLLAQLQLRYQQPQQVDQQSVVWQNANTRLSLEYPNTVRITDLEALTSMRAAKGKERELLSKSRKDFLEQF